MSDRIRIVFLTGELGLGGSEHQLFLLISQMDRTQFECHIIVFNPSNYFVFNAELEEMGVGVESIPPDVRSISQRMRYVYRRLRDLRPHIVHSWTIHDNPYAGIVGWLAGVRTRYGSLRNSLDLEGTKNLPPVFKFLSLYSIKRLFVNARSIASELRARQYPEKKIILLPNCVNLDLYHARPRPDASLIAEFGLPEDAAIVGMVANLRRVKNHHLFIEALARIVPQHPTLYGIIVGQPVPNEPDLPDELSTLIDRSGLRDRIILTGFRRDVPDILPQFDVLCLTSHSEGLPNVLLEAMAVGCPVASVRVGGVEELIVDQVTGLLVSPDDATGMARAINQLLDDEDLANRLSTQARQFVESHHDCNAIVTRLEQVYQEAVQHVRS